MVCGFIDKGSYRAILTSHYCLFPQSPHFRCEKGWQLCSKCSKPERPTQHLLSCRRVEIVELFLHFSSHCKFMWTDQRARWPRLCGQRLLSRPADLIRATLLVLGRIMSRFLVGAVSMPEANLPSMCLSKHERCEQGDPDSLPRALWDRRHKAIRLNTVWDTFEYREALTGVSLHYDTLGVSYKIKAAV